MKMAMLIAFGAFTLAANSACYASDGKSYLGLGIGNSKLDLSDPGADITEDSDTYIKIIGGQNLNDKFAIEFGYVDFGKFSAHYPSFNETDKAEGHALTAAGVGKVNITENIHIIGRIGLDYWNADVSADATIFSSPISASGGGSDVGIFFGAGIEMEYSSNIMFRIEIEKYNNVLDGVKLNIPGYGSIMISGEDVDLVGASVLLGF
jgi:OOP family OmpA-OmpF porin